MGRRRGGRWSGFGVVGVVGVMFVVGLAASPVAAGPKADVIVLPGATSAEGITMGRGSTFYAGDLFGGDIYRGDAQHGTAELFIDAPAGRMATGMAFDDANGLLFVAGAFTGQAYVYDTHDGSTVAVYQFADPAASPVINDVTLTGAGAWFTDSTQPHVYFVPVVNGVPGPSQTLTVTGPAADLTGAFNMNGIVSTPKGDVLIVAHTADASLYTVDPVTGASALITGVSVPNVDGIVLNGHQLWAIQNFSNQISVVDLSPDYRSGVVEPDPITNPNFEVPTTGALHGDTLAVVNAKFDTGFPPTASQYEVILVTK